MSAPEVVGHRLGPVAAVPPGEARTFTVGATQVAVFRLRSGELRAVDAVCPHSGGPLADGQFDTKKVICPLHNYLFEPATGRAVRGACPNAKTYKVRESGGDCEIWL